LAGLQSKLGELEALGAKVVAASADPADKAAELKKASGLTFPVGYGVTREIADRLGAFWDENRKIIQPTEFIVGADGKILSATYSSGPVGRVDPGDFVALLKFYEQRRQKQN
jgi:peroxiredoxin